MLRSAREQAVASRDFRATSTTCGSHPTRSESIGHLRFGLIVAAILPRADRVIE